MLTEVSLNQVTTIIFVVSAIAFVIGYVFGRKNTYELVSMGASQGCAQGLQAYEHALTARGIDIKSLVEASENTGEVTNGYRAGF